MNIFLSLFAIDFLSVYSKYTQKYTEIYLNDFCNDWHRKNFGGKTRLITQVGLVVVVLWWCRNGVYVYLFTKQRYLPLNKDNDNNKDNNNDDNDNNDNKG
ncbi:hypothetical protein Glove_340g22 [Diversispora epigaea]|uniref:Uncharacterized protein n=1 Tax=Diversispora epigaea TaxID=1348612 RepID=A0A397HMD9_9GLOM|nr:hypothetical protein Glove_340g22 [Diversispora epigaea]